MIRHLKGLFDPYIVALIATVAFASVLPPRGAFASLASGLANAGIVLLFFLHGAKLSREAILAGAGNWRLHAAVLGMTFAVFPLFGLGIAAIPRVPAMIASGMLFLCLLPSTVQSSIAFTSIARGNVAAAVCSASFSNLAGIAVTPLLAALLMGGNGAGTSLGAVEQIVLQLLLPFIAGHLLRPVAGPFIHRHKALVGLVDRGSILLVVYAAFGAAVIEGLWQRLPPGDLALIVALCLALLLAVLAFTWLAGGLLGLPRADRIVLLFAGSKKSLASGVPMAGVLFTPALIGTVILPLMVFHQIQLMACALIARRLGAGPPP